MTMTISGTSGLTMPGGQTQVGALTSGTAVASTSGSIIDFTGIPSWVKRITIMFTTYLQTALQPTYWCDLGIQAAQFLLVMIPLTVFWLTELLLR